MVSFCMARVPLKEARRVQKRFICLALCFLLGAIYYFYVVDKPLVSDSGPPRAAERAAAAKGEPSFETSNTIASPEKAVSPLKATSAMKATVKAPPKMWKAAICHNEEGVGT